MFLGACFCFQKVWQAIQGLTGISAGLVRVLLKRLQQQKKRWKTVQKKNKGVTCKIADISSSMSQCGHGQNHLHFCCPCFKPVTSSIALNDALWTRQKPSSFQLSIVTSKEDTTSIIQSFLGFINYISHPFFFFFAFRSPQIAWERGIEEVGFDRRLNRSISTWLHLPLKHKEAEQEESGHQKLKKQYNTIAVFVALDLSCSCEKLPEPFLYVNLIFFFFFFFP